jgi:hypothetical protein
MADDIVIKYRVDTTDFQKAEVAVQDVTNLIKEQNTEITKTYSNKSLDEAVAKLYEQGKVMDALVLRYGDANKALKAMQNELDTMAVLGQRGTKEFKELADETAHLKDTIGDTRGEIKKMASDTRVFDTMVQGARGITAAFTVATGAAAVLGSENKDLEKAILKVQGAMAALQGVQELANIATEKGGIATKAYGVALQVVDKISKVTGLSMAASWTLATAGISVVITAVAGLISWLGSANNKEEEILDEKKRRAKEEEDLERKRIENKKDGQKIINEIQLAAIEEMDKDAERQRKKDYLNNVDANKSELAILKQKLYDTQKLLSDYHLDAEAMDYKDARAYKKLLDDRVLDTKVALKKIQTLIEHQSQKPIDTLPTLKPDLLTIKPNEIKIEKVPEIPLDVKIKPLFSAEEIMQQFTESLQAIAPTVNALQSLTSSIFQAETQAMDDEKEKQLRIAGDNAKKKEQIERDFAIKKAKIARQEAITNKVFATFNAIVNTAQAVTKALPNYALVALAAATGALEIAAIAAAPLPTIPQFEKGGAVVLAGGRMEDGHLFGRSHRQGGMLINAQGGEYIWDIPTVQKHGDIIKAAHENKIEDLMFHKYVVPTLENIAKAEANIYDDWRLRGTIKQGQDKDRKNAEYIVNELSSRLSDTKYFAQRYK